VIKPIVLTRAEEKRLAILGRKGSQAARNKLAASLVPRVSYWARKYARTYGVDVNELSAAAWVGVASAIAAFDEMRGVRLSTYANGAILHEVLAYVAENRTFATSGGVRNRGKFFAAIKAVRRATAGHHTSEVEIVDAVASATECTRSTARLYLDQLRETRVPVPESMTDVAEAPEDALADAEERGQRLATIRLAADYGCLSSQERAVIGYRYGDCDPRPSHATIAKALGVSRQRVCDIEIKALAKLRQAVRESGCE
jgi:RNA polymerase sigma factor (sigma-70 family)